MPWQTSTAPLERARSVKAIVLDVDGVLTDGRIGYGDGGGEIKFFDVRDGHGVVLALRAGLRVGALSGRASRANEARARELGLSFLYQGERDKAAAFDRLLAEQRLAAAECLAIGDDLVDIPVLRRCGVAVAVADAAPELSDFCDFRTAAPGGRGAAREAIEWLLKAQGLWDDLIKSYIA